MKNYKYIILLLLMSNGLFSLVGQETKSTMIIGGEEVEIEQRPFQAHIRLNDDYFCGCTIINKEWVLTAAHCVSGFSTSSLTVVAGITELDQLPTEGQSVDVDWYAFHPQYNAAAHDNDIAIILLQDKLEFNTAVQPIRIIGEEQANLLNIGTDVVASGWGVTTPDGEDLSNHLLKVDLEMISNADADLQLDISRPDHSELTENMIAAEKADVSGAGPCHGDSGGPLTATGSGGVPYLIGAVSWGVPFCLGGENSPTIYANVLNYRDWIIDNTCEGAVAITTEMDSDVYHYSTGDITVSAKINTGVDVELYSGSGITLNYGFEAEIGSTMLLAPGYNCAE